MFVKLWLSVILLHILFLLRHNSIITVRTSFKHCRLVVLILNIKFMNVSSVLVAI